MVGVARVREDSSFRWLSQGTFTIARHRPLATFAACSTCEAVGPLTPFSTVIAAAASRPWPWASSHSNVMASAPGASALAGATISS